MATETAVLLNSEEEATIGPLQSCFLSCCCLKVQDRDTAPDWLLFQKSTGPPSLYPRLCWCMCSPEDRVENDIGKIEALRGLAGVTIQDGTHSTAGSLETLKWGQWDPEKRVLVQSVFGGFYSHTGLGLWTEPTTPCYKSVLWSFLMNLARTNMYQYRFEFSEDFRRADIRIQGNIAFLCCICCPFCPAWFTVPQWCNEQYMIQAADSTDGTHFERYCGVCGLCGGKASKYYDLRTAWYADGQKGPAHDAVVLLAPKQVQITA